MPCVSRDGLNSLGETKKQHLRSRATPKIDQQPDWNSIWSILRARPVCGDEVPVTNERPRTLTGSGVNFRYSAGRSGKQAPGTWGLSKGCSGRVQFPSQSVEMEGFASVGCSAGTLPTHSFPHHILIICLPEHRPAHAAMLWDTCSYVARID
jgi:hypothetical protein